MDGELVKVEIGSDGMIISIVKVDDPKEATHVITNSWEYDDMSIFGLSFEAVTDDTSAAI